MEKILFPAATKDGCTPTRWGIIGAGLISSDFCLALRTFPQNEHKVFEIKLLACVESPLNSWLFFISLIISVKYLVQKEVRFGCQDVILF